MVCSSGLRHPAFRVVKEGERIELHDYAQDLAWRPAPFTGTARVGRVVELFDGGATIVLQGLHLNWTPAAAYCRGLEAFLGHPAQANAYLTPRRSQGLPVHHDTHDVFVLQVDGTKRWLVYEPALELPLRHQRYDETLGGPGDPLLDVVLGPGDTLYLPRGWLHQALTSEADSLHLTIGVNVRTWIDAFRAALGALEDDLEFRRSVPTDGAGSADLVERLSARLEPEWVAATMRARFLRSRRPVLEGQLGQLRALDELTVESLVERRPTVIAELTELHDGRLALAFEGNRLVFPGHVGLELEQLVARSEPVRLADLPGRLDDDGKLVLAGRLVREGFLRLVG